MHRPSTSVVTRTCPSGEKEMEKTVAACSVIFLTSWPELMSHRQTSSSSPAVASRELSGQKTDTLTAAALGWMRVVTTSADLTSQMMLVPSVELEQRRVEPGENSQLLTLYL